MTEVYVSIAQSNPTIKVIFCVGNYRLVFHFNANIVTLRGLRQLNIRLIRSIFEVDMLYWAIHLAFVYGNQVSRG